MTELLLVGIGTGNPEHLTLQAVRALNSADLILIPRKGKNKADLAELRRTICEEVISNPATQIVEFELPKRDADNPNYRQGVDDWHDAIASVWAEAMDGLPDQARVALLVWGDPSLYDSTMRIAARLKPAPEISVIPGITSMQGLTAAHKIPLNTIGTPVLITTGRRLREEGWPDGADRLLVMLDGECSFQHIPSDGVMIWWGAYVGMREEILLSGALREMMDEIVETRAAARAHHGWIMDIYLLSREPEGDGESA
ncbi:Precorrin-6A synthase [deacetylating] [Candidatus Filomicrobium marinum]|uniref:Precorrin-6A synthase [deacetylating] n=2 Tax=Filomicrobium TaxID=119044 RepID=A0A0D6JI44_9HYPH|nr:MULTISPECIES: precorrin-6A synthase (deacetylating) [Filomicrobium]MCV0369572.1 precorrin-6A synthase (deacetylating) [Filomicrobium sp.]CFX45380.1 Precorrin-6A synthase [deacetylating] [Candidatus Filomicrobium marinum]CPR20769.1 Precorrin-6A synthase [deacetylating] [Candidatus Filomicrobium marinum]SDP19009.1 precorrin-6A synthase (deacetylating) [Filomicrobium insigne]